MAFFAPLAMNGQNSSTLTVYGDNTTTNQCVPIFGKWANSTSKCEFIIPKEKIIDMRGGAISAMKFYLSSSEGNQISATFDVFVKEVTATTLTGYTGNSDATTVFNQTITIPTNASNFELDIPFSSNYVYKGGNLLVGFYQTGYTGSSNDTYWLGEGQSTNTAWTGYGYSNASFAQQFLPKITFTYSDYVDFTYNANATSTANYTPFYGAYAADGTHSRFIIPKTSLVDLAGGTIRKLTFYSSTNTADWGTATFKVYVAEVEYSSFASNPSTSTPFNWSDMTQVYSGSLSLANGEMVIVFNVPFIYSGTKNLMIGFEETSTGTNAAVSWYCESGVSYSCAYAYNDPNSFSEGYTTGRGNASPKMTFNYRPTPYQKIAAINEGSITATTAELIWTDPVTTATITGYAYQYKKASVAEWPTDWSSLGATATSVTLSQLTFGTTYDFRIKVLYGENESLETSTSFATGCDVVTTFPWNEGFEDFEDGTVPMCWDNSASTSVTFNTYPERIWGVYAYGGNKMIRMFNQFVEVGIALINLPTIVLPAEGVYQLSFDYTHNASCGAFAVKVSTDNGTTFTELASYAKGSGSANYDPGNFTSATISLADYAGESIILQFFANADYGNGAIFVDNIEISLPTFTKEIDAYDETNEKGWYLIASPLADAVDLDDVDGLTNETFSLYRFNQSVELEWENYKAKDEYNNPIHSDFTTLVNGKGYLYANTTGDDLIFTGTPYSGTGEVSLTYTDGAQFAGWNLIGNPFSEAAYLVNANNQGLAYYRMNSDGDGFDEVANNAAIAPMEGIFYQATAAGTVYFSKTAPAGAKSGNLNMMVSQGRGTKDNAIIRFGEGNIMEKFSFREGSTKLYIPQDNKDYAVINAENQGEMPVSFKAEKDGTYTLSFNSENVSFNYLHLIDNMTGTNIDLLANPSYTFTAKTTDYASRFKLVFSANGEDGPSTGSGSFAFIDASGNIIINGGPSTGSGTLQIIDVTGRVIVQGDAMNRVSTSGMTPGVYVLRLIDGNDVRTQKMVIE